MLRPAESPRVRYGKTSGYGRRKKQPRLPNFPAGAEASVEQQKAPAPNATTVLPKVGIALALGTANRVSQKLCLSSALSSHYLVVSLMLSVCYTMVYSCVLAVKVAQKRVPLSDIRNAPVVLFAVIGFGEAAGSALGTYGAAKLGTSSAAAALLPVLSQSLLIWQLIWSKVVVNARFKLNNYAGVLLVAAGIALVSWPSSGASVAGAVSSASFSAVLACVFSTCPPALSTTAKQRVFAEMRQRLGGREVDLFVVNTLGSSLQVLFTLLFLPTVASARGVSLPELPNAFTSGFAVLFGAAGPWEPFFALLYALVRLLPLWFCLSIGYDTECVMQDLC